MNFSGNKKQKRKIYKVKVLIVVNNLRMANGVATVIMNQYKSLIDNGYDVDFMQFLNFDSPYSELVKSNKGIITTINKNFSGIKKICMLIKKEKYDIIHINQMNFFTVFLVIYAKIKRTKNIIYHSHNTKIPGGFKRNILETMSNIVYSLFSNRLIACSKKAGEDSFGKKKFTILKNSIDVKKFEYDFRIRNKLRENINISKEKFVIGTVCRIADQKNPMFMLDIISEVIKMKSNTIFLWIGSAPTDNDTVLIKIREKIKELNLQENVVFVGSKEDVYNWYSVMDVFLMPSKWEGLGITYIEAQANSLPTFASDVVPRDTQITNLIKYFSLSLEPSEWAKEICKYDIRNKNSKKNNYECFVRNGYDSQIAKRDLLNIYNSLKDEKEKK